MALMKCVNGENVEMSPDEEVYFLAERAAEAAQVYVPQWVTMRQARLALLSVSKLDLVATTIASLPSPQKEEAQIEWEYSSVVSRSRPLIKSLQPALGLTDAQLDQLFIKASTL